MLFGYAFKLTALIVNNSSARYLRAVLSLSQTAILYCERTEEEKLGK